MDDTCPKQRTLGVANVLTFIGGALLAGSLFLPAAPVGPDRPSLGAPPPAGIGLAFDEEARDGRSSVPPELVPPELVPVDSVPVGVRSGDASSESPGSQRASTSADTTGSEGVSPPQSGQGNTSSSRPGVSSAPPHRSGGSATSSPATAAPSSASTAGTGSTTSLPNAPTTTGSPTTASPGTAATSANSSPAASRSWAAEWGDDPGVEGQIENWLSGATIAATDFGVIADDGVDDYPALRAAIDAIADGGVVVLPAGVIETTRTIALGDGQVLRGQGSDASTLVFTRSLTAGIELGGAYSSPQGTVREGAKGSTTLRVSTSTRPIVGHHAILEGGPGRPANAGEVVAIAAVSGSGSSWTLTVETPLSQTLTGANYLPFVAGQGIGVEHLGLRPAPDAAVDYHLVLRATANSWVRNVDSRRARRAHVYTRQTADCEIRDSTFSDALDHGDGGRGYGVNLANRTTGCLVLQNRLTLLRHSMLLHDGATRNVVAYNHSSDPRHPNFVDGGPADMSFHGVATANLVEGNVFERTQLTDAGFAGADNTILRNCITSGPPTIRNEPTDAVIVGNSILGTNSELRSRIMPPVEWAPARAYTTKNLFTDDGVLVQGDAPGLIVAGNWFNGSAAATSSPIPRSLIQSGTAVPAVPTGVVETDCPYAPR